MARDEKNVRVLLIVAVVAVFVVISSGGVARVLEAGEGCLSWPLCLPDGFSSAEGGVNGSQVDFWHRVVSFLAFFPLAGLAVMGLRKLPSAVRILRLVWISLLIYGLQILIGGGYFLGLSETMQPLFSAFHFILSLGLLSVLIYALVALVIRPQDRTQSVRFSFVSPFARLSLATMVLYFFLVINGVLVSRWDANLYCSGWPICMPENGYGVAALLHRFLAIGSVGLVTALVIRAWQAYRSYPGILTAATATFVLFLSQALLGSRLSFDDVGNLAQPFYYFALHQATATAVWVTLLLVVFGVGLANRSPEQEILEIRAFRARAHMARDLFLLTKPVVVALLLVTTYAGMIIGGKAIPPLSLTFWTLLGGFLAAGGSGAINQYIDREDDQRMQRTQKRPIPSGRLMPGEGLAFGVGMLLSSFYVMVAFVNIIAALLCLAGMIYYVVIYSLILKKTTVQNIVIGGGAGAIPPLVGWAAATGSLNIPSLFLFAVIFMWTPPHFWALALIRRNDYARAGVPMLPVVKGEAETRKQILIYTLELVALTLLLPLLGLGGSLYFIGAAVLGLWLLHTAWKVWRSEGNKQAWRMYRHSSMYLAFLFFILAADALL